jgi:hypothetical protein
MLKHIYRVGHTTSTISERADMRAGDLVRDLAQERENTKPRRRRSILSFTDE